jgi:hypothetical protein
MTYPIANIIFGFPYTKEVKTAYAKALYDGDEDFGEYNLLPNSDKIGWEFLYSAGPLDFEPIGYFGIELSHKPYWELDLDVLNAFTVMDEQRAKFGVVYNELPPEVRAVALEPKLRLIWSDS